MVIRFFFDIKLEASHVFAMLKLSCPAVGGELTTLYHPHTKTKAPVFYSQ